MGSYIALLGSHLGREAMEDTICPRCRTTTFQNPSMKMLVNVCGHGLCESCVDLLFLKGSGSCPECKIPLRRNNFRIQLFEDAMVEKEIDIRKRILRDYNKREEDFDSLKQYNDYLEELENIVYNLTNDIDIVNTNKRIDAYKKENRDSIVKNKGRVGKEEYELEELLDQERVRDQARKRESRAEEVEGRRKRIREKEALIDELMFSTGDANTIVEGFKVAREAAEKDKELQLQSQIQPPTPHTNQTHFSSGIQIGGSVHMQANLHSTAAIEDPLYTYEPPSLNTEGPNLPSDDQLLKCGYVHHVRAETEAERAGGFRSTLACKRALQDALMALYYIRRL